MNLSPSMNELALPLHEAAKDPKVWSHLKEVITTSSGFDKWQKTRQGETKDVLATPDCTLDDLVRSYLRETLETLAY